LNGGIWRRFGLITQFSILALVLLAAAHLRLTPQALKPLLRTIVVTGGLIGLYGIFQYLGWDPFLPSGGYHDGEGVWMIVRPPGTLGQANYFATYLLFPAFMGVALLLEEKEVLWKSIGAAASGLSVFAIVLSGTRAAIVGLVIGGFVLLAWMRPRLRIAHFAAVACLLAVLAGFYYSPAGLRLRARMKWSMDDVYGGARLLLWRDSLRMAVGRPWKGYGPETFASNFPRFQSIELARAYPDFYYESPHNIFLDVLTAQGLFGLLIAFGFAGLGFYAAARARPAQPVLAGVLGSCLAAVLVTQQFTVFIAPNVLYYGVLVAMLVALAPSTGVPTRFIRIREAPLKVVAVCGIGTFALLGITLLLADYFLGRAQADLENLNVNTAIQDYSRMSRWEPARFGADLYYSRKMAELAAKSTVASDKARSYTEALDAGIRATYNAEDCQNVWYSLAALYAPQNDAKPVEQSLRASIACAPNWFKPHWTLAQVLRTTGRLDEAETEARLAANLDGGKNPEVNQTLYEIREARHTGQQ